MNKRLQTRPWNSANYSGVGTYFNNRLVGVELDEPSKLALCKKNNELLKKQP